MSIEIYFDFPTLRQQLQHLNRLADKAGSRTLVRVGTSTRAVWARKIREELNLPIGVIKRATSIYRNQRVLTISVDATQNPVLNTARRNRALSIIHFGAKQTKTGVTANIKHTKVHFNHAFIAHVYGGQMGVYQRTTKKRFPIRGMYTTALEDVAKDSLPEMEKQAAEQFEREFKRQLDYLLKN